MSMAASNPDQERYNIGFGELVPWDLTYRPTRNLYLDKVGVYGTTRAVAIDRVEERTLIRRLANGVDGADPGSGADVATGGGSGTGSTPKIDTRRPLEPDNHVLRLHQEQGKKNLSTWALRLIADNSNHSSAMECRGTMVIDQADDQLWGFLNDSVHVVQMDVKLKHQELSFNGAGFLAMLYDDPAAAGGKMTRGMTALSIHRNKGIVTDGGSLGALGQILTFQQPRPDVATEDPPAAGSRHLNPIDAFGGGFPGGPGSTIDTPAEPAARKATSQPSKKDEVMLRIDTKIRTPQGVGRWVEEKLPKTPPESGEPRLVHVFCLAELAPNEDPGLDAALDGNCDAVKLPKSVQARKIVGYVKVPRPGYGDSPRYDYSYHSPPPPPSSSTSGSDVATGGGPTPPAVGQNPDGSDPEDVDSELDGAPETDDPSSETGAPTEQAQHGYIGEDVTPPTNQDYEDLEQLAQDVLASWEAQVAEMTGN